METHLQPGNNTAMIKKAIDNELERGGQVYVIVPYIRHMEEVRDLLHKVVPNVSVIEAHGKHPDLSERIASFARGEVRRSLVSMTLIR